MLDAQCTMLNAKARSISYLTFNRLLPLPHCSSIFNILIYILHYLLLNPASNHAPHSTRLPLLCTGRVDDALWVLEDARAMSVILQTRTKSRKLLMFDYLDRAISRDAGAGTALRLRNPGQGRNSANEEWVISDAGGGSVYVTDKNQRVHLHANVSPKNGDLTLLSKVHSTRLGRWMASAVPGTDNEVNLTPIGTRHHEQYQEAETHWLACGNTSLGIHKGSTGSYQLNIRLEPIGASHAIHVPGIISPPCITHAIQVPGSCCSYGIDGLVSESSAVQGLTTLLTCSGKH